MNGIRCPKCDLVNLLSADVCHRCGTSLTGVSTAAQVSVPVEQTFQAQVYGSQLSGPPNYDNETGRKTFLWYRVYCGVLFALYAAVAVLGIVMVFASQGMTGQEAQDAIVMGAVYGIMGVVFAIAFGVALLLPRKPFNWIVGIVMIAFGLTSCCFLPATVPLLIFWLKPETKAYLGRF